MNFFQEYFIGDYIRAEQDMGKMDGVETLHRIKSNPLTNKITVIAVTSSTLSEDKERFLREGFDDYLAKPGERHLLLKTINQYLD